MIVYRSGRETQAFDPGVAKFGIALEWGSRGLEFESRHSDQKIQNSIYCSGFFIFNGETQTIKCGADERRSRRLDGGEQLFLLQAKMQTNLDTRTKEHQDSHANFEGISAEFYPLS